IRRRRPLSLWFRASLTCPPAASGILDTPPSPVIVNGSWLDLPYGHPGAIDPCQSKHGSPARPHVTKTIAGAAETAYFDGAAASGGASGRAATPRMALSGPVLIKRYDNRRLYRPDAARYLT